MSAEPKTITVLLDPSAAARNRAVHAVALAQRWGSHLVGVYLVDADAAESPCMSFAAGGSAMRDVIAYEARLNGDAEAEVSAVEKGFLALCAQFAVAGEFRVIGRDGSAKDILLHTLHSDLIVVRPTEAYNLRDVATPERLLIASGAPVLVVPNAWAGQTIGDKVLVGWNASAAAHRALTAAMPFLVAAKLVTVLVVNRAGSSRHGQEPGADIAVQLARHGARVHVDRISSGNVPVADAMLRYATESNADLLVLGAYSHGRWRELVFGGTTRSLLKEIPIPVLLSS